MNSRLTPHSDESYRGCLPGVPPPAKFNFVEGTGAAGFPPP